jgi:hypothetical protein
LSTIANLFTESKKNSLEKTQSQPVPLLRQHQVTQHPKAISKIYWTSTLTGPHQHHYRNNQLGAHQGSKDWLEHLNVSNHLPPVWQTQLTTWMTSWVCLEAGNLQQRLVVAMI